MPDKIKVKTLLRRFSEFRGKVTILLYLIPGLLCTPVLNAQNTLPKVNLEVKEATFAQVIESLRKQTNYQFVFNSDDVKEIKSITVDVKNANLLSVLESILNISSTKLTYEVEGTSVVITKVKGEQSTTQKRSLSGIILDEEGLPMTGVNVYVKGTKIGVYSEVDGKYTISSSNIPADAVVIFSFIGYETIELPFDSIKQAIVMKQTTTFIENAVVTGYFERDKSNFTGSVKTLSGDQLRSISTTNLFNSLAILDPSISITPNNEQGSNPNAIPEIILRGTTSLNTSGQVGLNTPLIVIDGVESTLRALYDIDIFEIESVTVLKDASATALYGEQAANGVILINRKKSSQKQIKIGYNLSGKFEFADVSDYNLMNAQEKLEFERLSGLYSDNTGLLYLQYVDKLARVNSGVNTDWISKPLRNSFSQQHNINLSGEGSGLSYQLSMRYSNSNGVMKDDFRRNLGIGYYMSYNLRNKLIATLRTDYSQNSTNSSKYGSFGNFVKANPYDAPYDANGELLTMLSYGLLNPIYEASLSSFAKTKNRDIVGSLNIRWNIIEGLYLTGFGSVTDTQSREDQFISPMSSIFFATVDPNLKGIYAINSGESNKYLLRGTANFSRDLDDKGSMITANFGGEVREDKDHPYSFSAIGFFSDKLIDPSFASSYPISGKPGGVSSESASVALTSSANIIFRNRLFADASYRLSGSSKFGIKNKYAPFWSVGAGWNLHREEWVKNLNFFDVLRLRASYGHTGSINFASYQAITTFRYASNLVNKYGVGASPITMGNADLKWQTTKSTNLGLTSTFFDSRFDLNFDWYFYRTIDMIVLISMPPSSGVTLVNNNVGEQTNNGFEVTFSGIVLKNNDWLWRASATAAQNTNKLIKIGNTLKSRNDFNAAVSGSSPLQLFIEGESPSMLYVVRSAGIDPASGKEIYIAKDGSYTYVYDPKDKVAAGDKTPSLRGALSSFLSYKGFSLNINMLYSYGGFIYNTTRAERIEQINPMYNSDKRAFTQRWKKPGDVVNYLTILPNPNGTINNYHTSRFVEKENYLSLSFISLGYEFSNKLLNKIGCRRLNLSLSMNDIARFSTIKQERGTSYPFARGFSFSISPTF